MSNQSNIFISYAWGGESEAIVNQLDKSFQEKGIILIRDKRDLGFKGMITDFMQQIGAGKAVITVISDKYLKSPYCMFELLEIYRNLKFQERIFPIVLADAQIFEPIPRLQYLKYWQDKKKELDDAIVQFGADAITVIGDDYKTYRKIFDNFGEVINILKDINSLTPQMHQENNFQILVNEVEKLCVATAAPIAKETADLPKIRDKALVEINQKRFEDVKKRIDMQLKLLSSYEDKLMLEDDPMRQMRYEAEIDKLKKSISIAENELNQL